MNHRKTIVILKGIVPLLFLAFFYLPAFAQQKLPIIRAHAKEIIIKDGDTLLKGAWRLGPEIKPDIYRTANSTHNTQVTFYTDIDSISFLVKPGDEYNFIILLNEKDSCYTRISTLRGQKIIRLENPVFINASVRIPLLAALCIIILIGYIKRRSLPTKTLQYLGIAAPLLFWLSTLIGGLLHGDYNHFTDIVSELGAIGTRSEAFMATTELLMALLTAFFMIGLLKACKDLRISILPILPIMGIVIGIAGIAFYPLSNKLHADYGSVNFIFLLSPVLALMLWKGKRLATIRLLALLSMAALLLIFTRFIPSFQKNFEGLIQRFFHLGWSIWLISLSVCFIKLLENPLKQRILHQSSPN